MPLINASALDNTAPEWLVRDMIPRTGIGFIYGPRTVGKSLIVNGELGLSIGNGTPFFGRETVHGSVVVCYGEGLQDAGVRKDARLARQAQEDAASVDVIRARRGDAAADAYAASLPAFTDEWFFPFTDPIIVPVSQQGEPTASLKSAVAQFKQLPDLEVVILDTVSNFSGGLSISNDASANRYVLGMQYMVRELNCLVLGVAHPTEKGDKMLGAGRLANAADFVWSIKPETGGQAGELKTATITCEKVKQGPEFDPISYVIEPQILDTPVLDENDVPIPGAFVPVPTATVRLREETGALQMPGTIRAARVLPGIRPGATNSKKRNGLRAVPNIAKVAMVLALLVVGVQMLIPHHHAPVQARTVAAMQCLAPTGGTALYAPPVTLTAAGTAVVPQPATGPPNPNAPLKACPPIRHPKTKAGHHHHRLFRAYVAYRVARHLVPYGIRHPFRRSGRLFR